MGIETRIGIVTGLVIVVVASVYFFYGKNSEHDQFVVATGSKVGDKAKPTEPPKIPVNADRPRQPRSSTVAKAPTVAHPGSPGTAGAPARPSPAAGSPQTASGRPWPLRTPPDKPGDSSVASGLRSSGTAIQGPPAPSEPRHPEGSAPRLAKRDEAKRDVGPAGANLGKAPSASPSEESKVTPLRTGPSQGLVDATRENIEKAQNPPTTTSPESASTRPPAAEPPRRTPIVTADTAGSRRPTTAESGRSSSLLVGSSTSPRQHKIAAGDTLAAISQKYLGDARRVSEILAANPQIRDPRRLKIGDLIVIPVAAEPDGSGTATAAPPRGDPAGTADNTKGRSLSEQPPAAPARTYQVKEGDTFYGIAKVLYGDGTRWHEIYAMNKAELKNDPKRLRPGMVLNLPE